MTEIASPSRRVAICGAMSAMALSAMSLRAVAARASEHVEPEDADFDVLDIHAVVATFGQAVHDQVVAAPGGRYDTTVDLSLKGTATIQGLVERKEDLALMILLQDELRARNVDAVLPYPMGRAGKATYTLVSADVSQFLKMKSAEAASIIVSTNTKIFLGREPLNHIQAALEVLPSNVAGAKRLVMTSSLGGQTVCVSRNVTARSMKTTLV